VSGAPLACQRTNTSGSSTTFPSPRISHLAPALLAQAVDADAVLLRVDQLADLLPQEIQPVAPALEDGVLNPLPEVLQGVGEPGSSPVVREILRNHDQHGKRNGSSSTRQVPGPGARTSGWELTARPPPAQG
jgi:hypothetical protein